ncbi:MAG: XdhC family protein, partial [Solirubrobacterales bacterium]|nr:XdhC family protein [Solirubrobacterales bacterium]
AVVLADGTIDGFVGGSCAESSVRLHSLRALETGEPVLLRIVPGEEIDSPDAAGPFEHAVIEHNPCLSGGALEIFLEPQLPPRRVMIVGETPVANALARIATAAGLDVSTSGVPGPGEAAVVVASHGSDEEQTLAAALIAGVPYVALVASRVRGEAVRESLELPAELGVQLHTPAGLDIGARTPEEIAVSILAELIAEHHAHPAPKAALSAVDPVCGMEVAVSEATPFLDGAEGRIYFCGSGCRDAYAAAHA